jgi:hypothetical protein
LRVRYDATPFAAPKCAAMALPEPDDTWLGGED